MLIPSFTQALAKFDTALLKDSHATVETVLKKLREAATVADALRDSKDWESSAFDRFLGDRSDQIRGLSVGDFLLWCGGWTGASGGHAIMYCVDRLSDRDLAWVTFNTGHEPKPRSRC